MLADQRNATAANHQERLKLEAVISLLMTRQGLTEARYSSFELDNSPPVVVLEDEHGVRIRMQS